MRVTINSHLNPYRLVPLALMAWAPLNRSADAAISYFTPPKYTPAQTVTVSRTRAVEGEQIAGYEITSDFGARSSPCPGCSEWHAGIDVATPIGTELKAPKQVEVTCWWDVGGGGEVADIKGIAEDDTLQVLHLDDCTSGSYAPGEVFATTGNTGNGTGPHLDVRWSSRQEPVIEDVEPLLTGKLPKGDAIARAGLEIVDSIKEDEGLRLNAYLDPVGVPTIGWGTTVYPDGRKVQIGDTITREQAEEYLQHDISTAQSAVEQTIETPLEPNELDALTSFQYNTGGIQGSTLAKKLNSGDKAGAAAELDRWVHGTVGDQKVVLPGLVTRRAREKDLFLGN